LATVLDLIATYFFMGPAIRLMAARGFGDRPRSLGIPDPTGRDEAMDASNAATEPEALATGGAS
jgi:hypothetical protein